MTYRFIDECSEWCYYISDNLILETSIHAVLRINDRQYKMKKICSPILPIGQGGRSCARRREWPSPKSLDSAETPSLHHFVARLRFVAIYTLFDKTLGKKVCLWVKNSVSWARIALLHGIYCILYLIKFAILQLHAKTLRLSRK